MDTGKYPPQNCIVCKGNGLQYSKILEILKYLRCARLEMRFEDLCRYLGWLCSSCGGKKVVHRDCLKPVSVKIMKLTGVFLWIVTLAALSVSFLQEPCGSSPSDMWIPGGAAIVVACFECFLLETNTIGQRLTLKSQTLGLLSTAMAVYSLVSAPMMAGVAHTCGSPGVATGFGLAYVVQACLMAYYCWDKSEPLRNGTNTRTMSLLQTHTHDAEKFQGECFLAMWTCMTNLQTLCALESEEEARAPWYTEEVVQEVQEDANARKGELRRFVVVSLVVMIAIVAALVTVAAAWVILVLVWWVSILFVWFFGWALFGCLLLRCRLKGKRKELKHAIGAADRAVQEKAERDRRNEHFKITMILLPAKATGTIMKLALMAWFLQANHGKLSASGARTCALFQTFTLVSIIAYVRGSDNDIATQMTTNSDAKDAESNKQKAQQVHTLALVVQTLLVIFSALGFSQLLLVKAD